MENDNSRHGGNPCPEIRRYAPRRPDHAVSFAQNAVEPARPENAAEPARPENAAEPARPAGIEAPRWREAEGGFLVAETRFFSLRVQWTDDSTNVRFEVRDRRLSGSAALVGAGIRMGVRRAMDAAESMALLLQRMAETPRPCVLVVDDDCEVRDAIGDALRDAGYEVHGAASGEDALRHLGLRRQPELVVADVSLGAGMDGVQLAEAIDQRFPFARVLLISGADLPGDFAPPVAFLAKPFSGEALLENVANIAAGMKPASPAGMH